LRLLRATRTATNFIGAKARAAPGGAGAVIVGLLDELEQQAQQRKANADDASKRKSEREEIFRTQLDPGMTALHDFLGKLVANLKILLPKKQLRYNLAGYGDIVGYIEHEYDLKVTPQPTSKEITLTFPCAIAAEECPTVEVLGAPKVRTVAAAFQRYHLGGMQEPKKDVSGEIVSARFNARGKIILHATFLADADSAVIKTTFVNFDALGTATKAFQPAQLKAEFFDEIGRYIMREPNNLFQEDLPDAYRVHLRSKIQQDEMKRRWETKISEVQQQELDKLKREQSLAGKFSKFLGADKPSEGGGLLGKLKGLVKKGE
jgi:hypothetical protein